MDPSLELRVKKSVKYQDCARLCLSEMKFACESISFNSDIEECKWSSLMPKLNATLTYKVTQVIEGVYLYYSLNFTILYFLDIIRSLEIFIRGCSL